MKSKISLGFLLAQVIIIALLLLNTVGDSSKCSAAVYLDGSTTGCSNGSTNYNPGTRTCGSGSDKVYLDLASFSANIVAGATNYIRAGSYFRDNATTHQGSLYITQSGTDDAHRTIVKAYPGEELRAIIGTATRGATYNSSPGDSTGVGSYYYYPNVVLRIAGNYITVSGLKVYGPTYFYGSNYAVVDTCDLGGGGSKDDMGGQGQVVRLLNTTGCVLRNSKVHNSCTAIDGDQNGTAVMWYGTSCIVERCSFYDNWYGDVRNKDGAGQAGRTTEVRYNFFGPSSIYTNRGTGFQGFNQAQYTTNVYVHHNIFYNKYVGIDVVGAPPGDYVFYQNTFVNNSFADIQQAVNNTSNSYKMYNNLFYHANQNIAFNRTYYVGVLAGTDWNIYYNTGIWQTHDSGAWSTVTTTLSGWQATSGKDASSLAANPNFVNASGNSPADFKRNSYAENFVASLYSIHAGAYETGQEIVGYTPAGSSSVVSAPTGLKIANIF